MYITYCSPSALLSVPADSIFATPKQCYSDSVAFVADKAGDDILVMYNKNASVAKVAERLKQLKVTEVVFWYNALEMKEPFRPVHKHRATLMEACDSLGITFSSMPIEEKLGGALKGDPTPYPPKGVSMNKKAEQTFLLRAQDEKGFWQNVRTSTFLPDLQIKARMLVKKFPAQKVEIIEEHKDEQFPI